MTSTQSVAQPTWHVLSFEAVKDSLQSDVARGLTQIEAARRLAQYGPNTLAQSRERSAFSILFAQFRSLIVALLVAATVIAFAMGENIEGFAILVVIVLNAAIGFFTEWKAEQALSALQKQSVRVAHVIRDGAESEISSAELVPGDLIVLAAGARVPADGRIVESARLQIEARRIDLLDRGDPQRRIEALTGVPGLGPVRIGVDGGGDEPVPGVQMITRDGHKGRPVQSPPQFDLFCRPATVGEFHGQPVGYRRVDHVDGTIGTGQ